jgi:hypothetical protein
MTTPVVTPTVIIPIVTPVNTVITPTPSVIPPELQTLYNTLYSQISTLVDGGSLNNFATESTALRVIVQCAILLVQDFKDVNGNMYTSQQKETVAMSLIKYVINDLAVKGKLDSVTAQTISTNLDFWGPIIINTSVYVADKVIAKVDTFDQDVAKSGCKVACKNDCCGCFGQ